MKTLIESAAAAKAASTVVAQLTTEQKNAALLAMADALESGMADILEANRADMERERANGMSESMLDRLMLNETRVRDMAVGLRQVAELPDPIGEVMADWKRPNGLEIRKVRVPMASSASSTRPGRTSRSTPLRSPSRPAARYCCAAAARPTSPTPPRCA